MNRYKKLTVLPAILLVSIFIYSFSLQPGTAAATPQPTSTTWHVAPGGADTNDCGSSQSPCASIQYAVEQAVSGDTIKVAAGTYTYTNHSNRCSNWYGSGATGVVCVDGKQISLIGGYSTNNWQTPNATANPTIIDGQNNHRGVFVLLPATPTNLYMQGFTIRNGRAHPIPIRGGKDTIYAFGGGMLVDRAVVTLEQMVFEHNQAIGSNSSSGYGGGGVGGGLALRSSGSASLNHVIFRHNTARGGVGLDRGGFGIGGAIFAFETTVTGSHVTAINNLAVGGNSNGSGHSHGEKADGQGGGIAIQINSQATFQHLTLVDNETRGGNAPNGNSGGGFGGGAFAEEASLTIRDGSIKNNLARGGTGKNHASNPFSMGGGIGVTRSNLTVERVEILGNTARGGDSEQLAGAASGGGITVQRLSGNTTVNINNTIIGGNLAAMGAGADKSAGGGGGGLALNGAQAALNHVTFANNGLNEPHMQGSGMLLFSYSANTPGTAQINYTIFANHPAGHALHVQQHHSGNLATLYEGLFDNNNSNTSNFGNIDGLHTMISGPARFVDPAGLNFRIQHNSAARDATSSSKLPDDVDNEKRDQNPDIGASEYIVQLPQITSLRAAAGVGGVVNVDWHGENMADLLHNYVLTVTCSVGASPPAQMGCGVPTDMGTATAVQLTGMTMYQQYTLTLKAYDSDQNLLAEAQTTAVPTDIFLFLPTIQR
jgi:hypothetical protein